jgi:hypothetical protein
MKASRVSDNKKKIGRPKTGVGALVGQRWHEEQLAQIDGWRRAQADMPGRAEAIRRLVEIGLKAPPPKKVNLTMKDSDGRILLPAGGPKGKGK